MKKNIENLSLSDKRLILAILISIPSIIFVGILVGFFKLVVNFDLIVVLIGIISAQMYRRIAKGYYMRVAIMSILTAVIGLIVVECVFNFGVEGLVIFDNYKSLFNFIVQEDMFNISWGINRLITILIAYSYARVI